MKGHRCNCSPLQRQRGGGNAGVYVWGGWGQVYVVGAPILPHYPPSLAAANSQHGPSQHDLERPILLPFPPQFSLTACQSQLTTGHWQVQGWDGGPCWPVRGGQLLAVLGILWQSAGCSAGVPPACWLRPVRAACMPHYQRANLCTTCFQANLGHLE